MTETEAAPPPLLARLIDLGARNQIQDILAEYPALFDAGKPDDWHLNHWVELLHYLARAYRAVRDNGRAIDLYRAAIALHDDPALRINLVHCYLEQRDYHQAELILQPLLVQHSDFAYGWFLRARGAQATGQLTLARHYYDQAASFQPDQPELLLAQINLARESCDWDRHEILSARARELRQNQETPDLTLLEATGNLLDSDDPADHRLVSILRSQHLQAAIDPDRVFQDYPRAMAVPGQPLRIGYLSANFIHHPGAMLMRGIFGHHDRQRVVVYLYALTPDDGSAYRRDAVRDCDQFRDLSGMGGYQAAQVIRDDGIQILIDMKGWTENNRQDILAWRPAPVQISYLGYAAPMIAPWIDYQIVDAVLVPPSEQADFGPRLLVMPGCYQPNDDQRPMATSPDRASVGLPEQAVVLACFNSPYKMTARMMDHWLAILRQYPDTVLWLLVTAPEVIGNLRRRAEQHQIDPERLIFATPLPPADHLARLSLADIAVDTFPYGGHTSTSDALWAGVPVVTLRGNSFAARVAASLLSHCNLGELIAGDDAAYQAIICRLIEDAPHRMAVHDFLRQHRASLPLFQTRAMAGNLENAYLAAWQDFIGRAP